MRYVRTQLEQRLTQVAIGVVASLGLFGIWKLAGGVGLPEPVVVVIAPVLAFLPLVVLLVFKFPFYVVLGFVLFAFFRLHEAFPVLLNLRIPQLLSLGSLAVLFWHLFITEKLQVYWRKELQRLSIFVFLIFIGVPMATNMAKAQFFFSGLYIKIYIMVLAIAWLLRKPGEFAAASRLIALCGIAIGAIAIDNKNKGIGLVEGTRVTIGRDIGSVLGDPNDLSLTLLFPLSFAVSLAMTRGSGLFGRLLGVTGIVTLVFAILATQSRGGLLGIMTVFSVFGWRYVRNKLILIGVGGVAALGLFVAAGITDRSSGGAAEDGIDESAMGRIYAWHAAWGMAMDHPLTGVGLANFFNNYYLYTPHWDGKNHAVHSTWFGVLAESGFLGFGVFLSLFVMVVGTAIHNLKIIDTNPGGVPPPVAIAAQAMIAGLLGTAVSGTFLTQGFTWPFYILIAFTVAVSQYLHANGFRVIEPEVKEKFNLWTFLIGSEEK